MQFSAGGVVSGLFACLAWGETQNVKWKTAIHDRGWSSLVLFGDLLILHLEGTDVQFIVALNKKTGQTV